MKIFTFSTDSVFESEKSSDDIENNKIKIAQEKMVLKNELADEGLDKLLELEKIPARDVVQWKKEQKCKENQERVAELAEYNRKKREEKLKIKEENRLKLNEVWHDKPRKHEYKGCRM